MINYLDKVDINQAPSDEQLQKNFVTADNINTLKNELVNVIEGQNALNSNNDENLLKIFTFTTHLRFDIYDITFDNNTSRKITINMKGDNAIRPKTTTTTNTPYVNFFNSYSSPNYKNEKSSTKLKNLIGIINDGFNWEVSIFFWSNDAFGTTTKNDLLAKKVINITTNILYKKCVLCSILKNYNTTSQKVKRVFDLMNNDNNMNYYQQNILNIGQVNTTLLYSTNNNNIVYLNGNNLDVGIIDIKEHPLTWYLFKDNNVFVEQTDDPNIIKIKTFNNKYIRGASDITLLGSQQINQVGIHSHKTNPISVSAVPDGNPTILGESSEGNELSSSTVAWSGRKLPITVNIPELTTGKQLDKNGVLVDNNYKTEVDSFNLLYYMNVD